MEILFCFYIVSGLLLVALAIPLIKEKVKPNGLYGFRVRQTLSNPRIWYAVNKHFGKRLLIAAIGFLIGSVGLYFVPGISTDAYAMGCLLIFVVLFTFGLVQSFSYLRALTSEPE
jgi:hypothetical protein